MPNVQPPRANRLLARLPAADFRLLEPLLKPVKLAMDHVIYESRGPIEHAYFPLTSVFSALTIMHDGMAIEVATVGNEGMVGPPSTASGPISPNKVVVQVGGTALRVESRAFREEVARGGPLRELMLGYQSAFLVQVSQSVACNGLHRLEQRCCRWLLMTRDRVESDEMPLTHEYLAFMLGARRASVTEVLKPLSEAGLVRSHRGKIRILDRPGLEALACECYWVVKEEHDRLLGPPT